MDYGTTERIALAVWLLGTGGNITTAELAQKCEMSTGGAYKLLHRINRVIPLACTDGRWRIVY